MPVTDFVLVDMARIQIGDEKFPDAAAASHSHRMASAVPAIEIADDAHPFRIGCPDGKKHAGEAIDLMLMGAEKSISMAVPSFSKQMQIEVAHLRCESVGIVRRSARDGRHRARSSYGGTAMSLHRHAIRRYRCRAVVSSAARSPRCGLPRQRG